MRYGQQDLIVALKHLEAKLDLLTLKKLENIFKTGVLTTTKKIGNHQENFRGFVKTHRS